MLAAPVALALSTASTPHSGALPTAGPGSFGGPGGGFRRGGLRPQFGNPGRRAFGPPPGFGRGGGFRFGGPRAGGLGGLLDASTPSAALVELLRTGAMGYRWAAATVGANSAAGIQLATGKPIMAIGGFNGTDPAPTLAQFEQLVSDGKVHYFLGGGRGGGSDIESWVAAHFSSTTVGGVTVYDLSQHSSA